MGGGRELPLGRLRQAAELESSTKGYSPQGSYSSLLIRVDKQFMSQTPVFRRIVEQHSLKIQMLLSLDCPEGIGVHV